MVGTSTPAEPALPDGWVAESPTVDTLPALVALSEAHLAATRGTGSVDDDAVLAAALGTGSWTRRQVVVRDPRGAVQAWASVHDRASGRTDVRLVVHPQCPDPDVLAPALIDWQLEVARALALARALPRTLVEAAIEEHDVALQGWLKAAGFAPVRRWLHMVRPVRPDDELPRVRAGVTVRRVGVQVLEDQTSLPVAEDLQLVHQMLEESFEDHFNSYRESFPEFAQRLREDPGHRWDHWWLAFVDLDGESVPAGALVSSVLSPRQEGGPAGTYVDYIGVHRRARGRGVAKALLGTVLTDAVQRGRDRVGLEVDEQSPTGAADLYRSLGWATSHVTESWHQEVAADDGPGAVSR